MPYDPPLLQPETPNFTHDFADVKGHANVKRALEVAAAGGHNLILLGPPGSGKTMMARRLPSILPSMSVEEALEATKVASVPAFSSQCACCQMPHRFKKAGAPDGAADPGAGGGDPLRPGGG